jgi:hypothetical protein
MGAWWLLKVWAVAIVWRGPAVRAAAEHGKDVTGMEKGVETMMPLGLMLGVKVVEGGPPQSAILIYSWECNDLLDLLCI